jgi:hypothetical protein
MKSLLAGPVLALVAALGVALGLPAHATVIASNVLTVTTASGSITVVSTVDDYFWSGEMEPPRWRFRYQVSGNYDPLSPDTNGISSLQILFGGLVPDVAWIALPLGWDANSTGVAPPFGVGFDLPNSVDCVGYGIENSVPCEDPNSGDYSFFFTVPAGTAFTSEDQRSYAGSHFLDVPYGLVSLVDDASGQGPIVPVPEPASLLLLAGGLAAFGPRRLSSAQ